jgi:putative DNA primase/helicase
MDGIEEFKGAMRAHGLNPPEIIEPGKLNRFPTNGRASDDAGWCKLFPEGQGGVFGDFRSGLHETWQARREKPFTPAERTAFRQRCEAERRAREAEMARLHAKTASKALAIWKAATPARADHPYLTLKCVAPVAALRETPANEAAAILGCAPKSQGEPSPSGSWWCRSTPPANRPPWS